MYINVTSRKVNITDSHNYWLNYRNVPYFLFEASHKTDILIKYKLSVMKYVKINYEETVYLICQMNWKWTMFNLYIHTENKLFQFHAIIFY